MIIIYGCAMRYQDLMEGVTDGRMAQGDLVTKSLRVQWDGGGYFSLIGPNAIRGASAPNVEGTTRSFFLASDDSYNDTTTDVYARWVNVAQFHETPQPWEVAWLFFRIAGKDNLAYISVKTNGWEYGIRHPSYKTVNANGDVTNDGQKILATGEFNVLAESLKTEVSVRVQQRGRQTLIQINGTQVWKRILALSIDSKLPHRGAVGWYGEDCVAELRAFTVCSGVTP